MIAIHRLVDFSFRLVWLFLLSSYYYYVIFPYGDESYFLVIFMEPIVVYGAYRKFIARKIKREKQQIYHR